MAEIKILGIKINQIDLLGVLGQIDSWLADSAQQTIFTVNPEFVMASQKNDCFRKILNSSSLNVCDGAGTAWAGKFLFNQTLPRVTGVELTEKLLAGQTSKIYLLGGSAGSAEALMIKYPQSVAGANSQVKLQKDFLSLENNLDILQKINQSGANILLVAFGQVKQETWINQNLTSLPNIKVAIGVGGTFDYLAGKVKRAPGWMRGLGLEWLFRLVTQPHRIGRIWNATAGFSWLVLLEKMRNQK